MARPFVPNRPALATCSVEKDGKTLTANETFLFSYISSPISHKLICRKAILIRATFVCNKLRIRNSIKQIKKECIPAECVPPASMPISGTWGGVWVLPFRPGWGLECLWVQGVYTPPRADNTLLIAYWDTVPPPVDRINETRL